jgi:ferrochelatase
MSKKGILLINLGTPDSPFVKDVRKYLNEFLMDERVIDINPLFRTLLVKGVIVPCRARRSAKLYQQIWNGKLGSPLLHYSNLQHQLLKLKLGDEYHVELAMRYQYPSIQLALQKLRDAHVNSIKVIPLFPQYASATTGSVYQKVMEVVSNWPTMPNLSFINSFSSNPLLIKAWAENAALYSPDEYDHVLFSFHGLPERQLRKCDLTQNHCLKSIDCCQTITDKNRYCYSAQCYQTAQLIIKRLNIPNEKYTLCFQSRLGNTPWMQPY